MLPQLNISYLPFSNKKNYQSEIQKKKPGLIFLDMEEESSVLKFLRNLSNSAFEIILIASKRDYIFEAIQYKISGYLLKPLDTNSLKSAVNTAIDRITLKKNIIPKQENSFASSAQQVIGIPTMEGYEYLHIQKILRCESYLKCTRIITIDRTNIISSYNIGEFINALEKYGFFAPHQSHLINLGKVKKYLKDGTIIMCDNSAIPVARRRRIDFLAQIPHI